MNNALEGTVETIANEYEDADESTYIPYYTLQGSGSTEGLPVVFRHYNGATFKGFKAYLYLEESASQAISIRFGDDDGTTEIETSTLNSQPSTEVYDLMGRRVLNPAKGVYIVGGKKVIF